MEDEEEYLKPMLPTVPEKCGPPFINLGHLIEFAVQQILHELTVLSELLPKKLDADRKISIVQFAHSTRTLFIKLLAVVKWVKTSKKFESCSSICYFLDQQAQYFVDTADRLVQLSREELIHARLPAFQVPAAVDVLTLGTYPRLPLCIKSRFIPSPPISKREEACVLARLNQVIQSRISSAAAKLSPRIKNIVIKNGMVNLIVPGEFEVSLTLLGERPTTKWTLLNIRILVEDYEIGFGTKLVHPLQLNMVHNALQIRMDKSQEPLKEAYMMLHTFAQSLQLDVLYCQATQVLSGNMRQYATIECYNRSEGVLIVAYWLRRTQHNKYTSQYRFKIFVDPNNSSTGLRTRHFPGGRNMPQIDDRTGRLSISRLLSETVAVRCRERLLRLRERLESLTPKTHVVLTGKATPTLTYPLLTTDSHDDEKLIVSMNAFSGNVLAVVTSLGARQELRELEQLLNDYAPLQSISRVLARLRILLMMERYRKAVAPLPVRIVPENVICSHISSLQGLPSDRICLQFVKEDVYSLIVTFTPDEEHGVDIDIYLLSSVDGKSNMVRLHPSQMLSSAPTSDFSMEVDEDDLPPPAKRQRWLGSTKQLTSAVATIDDRLAFTRICEELDRRNVKYRPLTTEPIVGGLILRITDVSGAIPDGPRRFFKSIVSCSLRLDIRSRVIWPFECTLIGTPLIADFHQSTSRALAKPSRVKAAIIEISGSGGVNAPNTSENVSSNMIDRLYIYAFMFEPVRKFAVAYNAYFHKFCNITAFTYHKLVIAYGEQRNQLMILTWKPAKANASKQFYYLSFAIGPNRDIVNRKQNSMFCERETLWNPHILLQQLLQERFNHHCSLIELVQYLIDSVEPLSALQRFTRIRLFSMRTYTQMLSLDCSLPISMQANLTIVDLHTVRLLFGPIHLEFLLLGSSRVGIRDCARGSPTAYKLRAFCNKYVCHELITHDVRSPGGPSWLRSPSGPYSLPPHQMGRSPATRIASSPMSHMSLSVPPAEMDSSPMRYVPGDHSSPSRSPILVDHLALRRMTTIDESGSCPLYEYLFALSYLHRLGPALEGYRQDHRGPGGHPIVQFRQLKVMPDSIRLSVLGAAPPNLKHEPFVVNLNIYLDEETMSLKLKLDFDGEEVPSPSDVRIAERYFERCVARLGNELAVVAFVNACRLTLPGTFSAVVQLMAAQMEWTENSPWKPSMQLVMWSNEGTVQRARVSPGIVIDQTNVSVLILICLRPTRPDPLERNADASKHLLTLVYNTQTNVIIARRGGAEDDAGGVSAILANICEQCSHSNERPLWPAVHALAHKFMQNS